MNWDVLTLVWRHFDVGVSHKHYTMCFIMLHYFISSHNPFAHIFQGCLTGTGTIPQPSKTSIFGQDLHALELNVGNFQDSSWIYQKQKQNFRKTFMKFRTIGGSAVPVNHLERNIIKRVCGVATVYTGCDVYQWANFLRSVIFPLFQNYVILCAYWIPRSYLTGVAAAQLWRHL